MLAGMSSALKRSLPIAMVRQIADSESKAVAQILGTGRTLETVVEAAKNAEVWSDSLCQKFDAVNQPKLACQRGCAWCCHQKVTATPPEVFAIADFLRKTRTFSELAELKQKILAAEE